MIIKTGFVMIKDHSHLNKVKGIRDIASVWSRVNLAIAQRRTMWGMRESIVGYMRGN